MGDGEDEDNEDDEDSPLGVRGEREEEKCEVRCDSLYRHCRVEWIYAPGMKSLRFVSSAKFS